MGSIKKEENKADVFMSFFVLHVFDVFSMVFVSVYVRWGGLGEV